MDSQQMWCRCIAVPRTRNKALCGSESFSGPPRACVSQLFFLYGYRVNKPTLGTRGFLLKPLLRESSPCCAMMLLVLVASLENHCSDEWPLRPLTWAQFSLS